jgi:lipopolysaccharide/colanic/teichoic acid biosynthesis glycosyltransferase
LLNQGGQKTCTLVHSDQKACRAARLLVNTPEIQTETKHAGRHPLLELLSRGRFQLLLALTISVFVPYFLRLIIVPEDFFAGALNYTSFSASIAVITGFFIFRKFDRYPETELAFYVVFSYLICFGIVALFFLLFRVDYSRFALVFSFLATVTFFLTILPLIGRFKFQRYAMIPGGDVAQFERLKLDHVRRLEGPDSELKFDECVIVDLRYDHLPEWERFIADCTLKGIPVFHFKQVLESVTGRVEIDHLSESNFGSVLPDDTYLKLKASIDFVVTVLALPLLLPIMGVVAVFIRAFDGGPVLFRQKRIGFRGKEFTAYKFRSMAAALTDPRPNADNAMTRPNDPRITRIGMVLRKYRLDELPQVLNILRGEMSWIGPRPEAVSLVELYEQNIPFYRYRHAVRPGITGWAQVKQGHVTSVDDVRTKLKFDFFYIKHVSFSLDVVIVIRTLRTVLHGSGAR